MHDGLEDWSLHDCILLRIEFFWKEAVIELHVDTGLEKTTIIKFSGVSGLIAPKKDEWGLSNFIHYTKNEPENVFSIQMQCGDIISITAGEVHWPL